MKTKFLNKAFALILTISILFTLGSIVSFAETHVGGAESKPSELFKLDNGDISTFTGFEKDEHLSYVYYYQGTEPWAAKDFSNGVYPMTKSTNSYGNDAYIVGVIRGEKGDTWNYNNVYASANGIYAPQYHFSPGLAFEAPLTGTFRFTIQYTIPNANHRIVVAKSSVPLEKGWEHNGNIGIFGGAVGTLIEKTIDIDLTKGEQAYFLVDNINNGDETRFHIRSVERVYGDLNENPVTFIAAQETAKKENGRFDVRLISALNSLEYKSVGYKFSIEVDGVTKVPEESVAVKTVYGKLLKYGEGGAEEFQAPQNTNLVGGLFENLPTDKTVKITVCAYAETTEGKYYYDSGCVITYTNGVFTAMDNIA